MLLLASSEQVLQHALDRFSAGCCQVGMKISTKKTRCYVSPETQVCVYAATKRQCTAARGRVQEPCGGNAMHESRKEEQGD